MLPEATNIDINKTVTTLASDNIPTSTLSQDSAKPSDNKLDKSGTESDNKTDSDTTIIYEPPPSTKPQKIVTFETVTHGIKITKKT